ncbi:hypothetical protein BDZ97DRAFT_907317 [Flammula alnicola]|nr:hypothetical protein BDZ97DRAFT_907317 [Flammula alnicola]
MNILLANFLAVCIIRVVVNERFGAKETIKRNACTVTPRARSFNFCPRCAWTCREKMPTMLTTKAGHSKCCLT